MISRPSRSVLNSAVWLEWPPLVSVHDQRMNNEASDKAKYDFDDEFSKRAARKLQLVRAGASQFGIFAEEISAIVAWREPTSLPHAPNAVLGVVSIEGRMLTVLDLSVLPVREATGDAPRNPSAHLIALRGDEQLALAVEAVGEIIAFTPNDSMTDSIARSETATTLVLGVLQHEGAELKILNLKSLFPTAIQGRERRQRRF